MRRFIAIIFVLLCMLSTQGCIQQPQEVQKNHLLADGNIIKAYVSSLPPGQYNYSYNGEDAKAIADYLSGLNLESSFQEDPDKYDGMTWVIALEYESGEVLTVYHFGNMFIRSEQDQSWYKMTYDEAARFDNLLNELNN